ncbi:MAG: sce7726 family protein [Isosphaeraceae bacterium]
MRDFDIRRALRALLEENHNGESSTLIIDELGLRQGKARADMAVINGSIDGYEIKSELDTLDRLPQQSEIYGECFDSITLVVGSKHLMTATAKIPGCWGIMLAEEKDGIVELTQIRHAQKNEQVNPEAIVQLLWREEVTAALKEVGITHGLRTKKKKELSGLLVSALSSDRLRLIVRDKIKARGDWRVERRQARCSDSSPMPATAKDRQANLTWLLSLESPNPHD